MYTVKEEEEKEIILTISMCNKIRLYGLLEQKVFDDNRICVPR